MGKGKPRKAPILQVGNVLVSSDVVETYFACNLSACHGACCIEGDSGAPVAQHEVEPLCQAFTQVTEMLPPTNLQYIEQKGLLYTDEEGDLVTNIVEGGRCVFTCFEADGSCRCAFEKSYTEQLGNTTFYKPLSCHLYPIRVRVLHDGTHALNYDRWHPICEPARLKGKQEGVRLYQFVKAPLERAYGKEWYHELETVAAQYLQQEEEEQATQYE